MAKRPFAYRNCITCEVEFGAHHTLQFRCKTCHTRYRNTKPKLYTKACSRCGDQFHPKDAKAKTCAKCRIEFPCRICGTLVKRRGAGHLHCSERCSFWAKLIAKHGDWNYLEALKRDNFQCRVCGNADAPHVHHIDNRGLGYPKEERNNALDNMLTLCNPCHMKAHTHVERRLYEIHPETARAATEEFLSLPVPQTPSTKVVRKRGRTHGRYSPVPVGIRGLD